MAASLSIIPVSCSDFPPLSLAVMVWLSPVTVPVETLGVPPRPRALPMAATGSPTWRVDEEARVTVGRPETPSIWIRATSAAGDTPMTWAVEVPEGAAVVDGGRAIDHVVVGEHLTV